MFVPGPERQRQLCAEARCFDMLFRTAQAYVEAGRPEVAEALWKALPPSKPHPEEGEWFIGLAYKALQRRLARDMEESEEELRREDMAAAEERKARENKSGDVVIPDDTGSQSGEISSRN